MVEHGSLRFYSFGMLIVGPGLLSTSGAVHKKQRKLLNPVFSGAHMRDLTPIFHDVVQRVSPANATPIHAMILIYAVVEDSYRDAHRGWASIARCC